jgi:hypothetical protein
MNEEDSPVAAWHLRCLRVWSSKLARIDTLNIRALVSNSLIVFYSMRVRIL